MQQTILDFDKVFGLGFENLKEEKIPEKIIKLTKKREQARKNKDFKKSDEPQIPVISIVGRNNNEISKFIKLFYLMYTYIKLSKSTERDSLSKRHMQLRSRALKKQINSVNYR